MKIALIGYGKMGQAIDKIATSRGHEVVLKINEFNTDEFTKENLQKADVAIEFSAPHAAYENIMKCMDAGIPMVCGTTAWLDKLAEVKAKVTSTNGSFIFASNYSLGVNLFFVLNEQLAKLMAPYDYKKRIVEIHHTAKLDAPSGTAITIAEGIMKQNQSVSSWQNNEVTESSIIPIISERIDPAPGTHIVTYSSPIDTIKIEHEAHSREGFALGAVIAAEWLPGKKGVFGMRDVLGFEV
jgi:4-hydroxy-tetrahydrodipicolinate reductase